MREHQAQLLALCRVKDLSWFLVAREAMRPDGLARLLAAEAEERSVESRAANRLIRAARTDFPRLMAEAHAEIESSIAEGIRLTTVLDDDYPLNLRLIFNAPPFLFYRGRLVADDDARSVAVVGTREASVEGLRRAARMAGLLAHRKVTVLSGLARGIDTAAHAATLEAGGRTVSVLGSGLRRIYPPENRLLADRIAEAGALVSQFWLDSPPAQWSFPRRNITMSGMGQGTVVIEASATSGAKMQARLALDHGKKVFLLSSLVTGQKWAKNYLARGAVEVDGVDGVVAALRDPDIIRTRTQQAQQLSLMLR